VIYCFTSSVDLEVQVDVMLYLLSFCFRYSSGLPYPSLELTGPGNGKLIKDLMSFLELRMNKKNDLLEGWQQKCEYFSLTMY
jgi:hypothetical protein